MSIANNEQDYKVSGLKFSEGMIAYRELKRTDGYSDIVDFGEDDYKQDSFNSQLQSFLDNTVKQLQLKQQNVITKQTQQNIPSSKIDSNTSTVKNVLNKISGGFIKKNQTFANSIPESQSLLGFDTNQPFTAYYMGGNYYSAYVNFTTTIGMYNAYTNVMPCQLAIDYIRMCCTQVPLDFKVKEKKDGDVTMVDYDPNTDNNENSYLKAVFDRIHFPNPTTQKTKSEFISSSVFELLMTGNAFFIITHEVKSVTTKENKKAFIRYYRDQLHPKYLRVAKTIEIMQKGIEPNQDATMIDYSPIFLYTPFGSFNAANVIEFTPDADLDRRAAENGIIRYFSKPKKNTNGETIVHELWHMRYMTGNTLISQPPLLAVVNQMSSYYLMSLFHKNYFSNGGAPSYLFKLIPFKTDDYTYSNVNESKVSEVASQIETNIRGAKNAGRIMLHANAHLDLVIEPITINVKDADLKESMADKEKDILKILRVPASFFNERKFKDDDTEDRMRFFEDTIFPIMNIIIENLNFCFMTKYDAKDQGAVIEYNKMNIEIFKKSKGDRMVKYLEAGAVSQNEVRKEIGYASIGPDGDKLYMPTNKIPVGKDTIAGDGEFRSNENDLGGLSEENNTM